MLHKAGLAEMVSYMWKWARVVSCSVRVCQFSKSFCDGKGSRPVFEVEGRELMTRGLQKTESRRRQRNRIGVKWKNKPTILSPPFSSCWPMCTQTQVLQTWSTHV